jgi:hypothetical protein
MATPAPNQRLRESPRLDALGYDIQYLIAAELIKFSPSAVLALSHCTRSLRQAALPFVYRDIILTQGRSGTAYKALLKIMREDESCDKVKHVRNITVTDDIPEGDILLFFNKCAKCTTLKKLRCALETECMHPELIKIVGTHQHTYQIPYTTFCTPHGPISSSQSASSIARTPSSLPTANRTRSSSHPPSSET